MPYRRAVLLFVHLGLCACGGSGDSGGGGGAPPTSNFANFQFASAIIGQTFATTNTQNNGGGTANPNQIGLEEPNGHVALGSLYVPDTKNNRVLGFAAIPTGFGTPASFAIGVPDFITVGGNGNVAAANAMLAPNGCCVSGGKLFVADGDFERVLVWNTLPTSNVAADVAIGQGNLITEGPLLTQAGLSTVRDVCVAAGKVVVADYGNNRVMIWNSVPASSGVNANLVLGQPDFTTNTPGLSSTKMNQPTGVWTDGTRLVVTENANNRVLVWSTFPTSSGQAASFVLGQPDFVTNSAGTGTSKMFAPWSVTSDGTQLFVVDRGNQRVLIYNPFPTPGNTTPIRVLGQSNFTNSASNDDNQDNIPDAGPSARTFFAPTGVTAIGNQLFVSDMNNHRVLIFTGS